MKRLLSIILLAIPTLLMAQKNNIVIIYENDAHSTLPGYAKLATLKAQTQKESKNVLTVSGGDFSCDFMSRNTLGTKSQGAGIIEIMNSIGYDFIVPGNHDFDFGIPQIQDNFKKLKATVLCCNFFKQTGNTLETVFTTSSIKSINGKTIAFIGVATPKTMSSRNKQLFCDEEGNQIYGFTDGEQLFEEVQKIVTAARTSADYVIVLSHLGDKSNSKPTSLDLIAATTGIDVVLDAHAHSVIPDQRVQNKDGKEVILTSTGLKFANIGLLTISEKGEISTKLVPTADLESDASTLELIDKLNKEYGVE